MEDPEKAAHTGLIFALDYNKDRMMAEKPVEENLGYTRNLYDLQNS